MRELLSKLPTPNDVLTCTPQQLDAILLAAVGERIRNGRKDQTAARYVSDTEIQGIYPAGITLPLERRRKVDSVFIESWERLLRDGFLMQAPGQSRGVLTLTTKGEEAAGMIDLEEVRMRQALRREMLHPELRGSVYDNFAAGHYDTAILDAFKLVEVVVRDTAGLPQDLVGVRLMRKAFDPKNGMLADATLPEQERERMVELFAGAVGVFKNSVSHRKVGKADPGPVIEELMLASRLLRFVKP